MMGDLRPEKKNRFIWDRALFRRKCIRLIAYVCVFFNIVNKKMSDRSKKWLSVSTCGLVVVLAMIFSLAGYKETEVTGQEVSVVAFLPESHNRVTGGQREASIEMNCSRVAEDKNNSVVSVDQPESTTDQQANRVVDKPVLLSPVQALLVNNGEEKQSGKAELRTQHLIGVGEESRQNFDSVQSVAGINKAMQNVDEDGQSVTASAIQSDGQPVTKKCLCLTYHRRRYRQIQKREKRQMGNLRQLRHLRLMKGNMLSCRVRTKRSFVPMIIIYRLLCRIRQGQQRKTGQTGSAMSMEIRSGTVWMCPRAEASLSRKIFMDRLLQVVLIPWAIARNL